MADNVASKAEARKKNQEKMLQAQQTSAIPYPFEMREMKAWKFVVVYL